MPGDARRSVPGAGSRRSGCRRAIPSWWCSPQTGSARAVGRRARGATCRRVHGPEDETERLQTTPRSSTPAGSPRTRSSSSTGAGLDPIALRPPPGEHAYGRVRRIRQGRARPRLGSGIRSSSTRSPRHRREPATGATGARPPRSPGPVSSRARTSRSSRRTRSGGRMPLRSAGAEVELRERPGGHGDALWRAEFPRMVSWAARG